MRFQFIEIPNEGHTFMIQLQNTNTNTIPNEGHTFMIQFKEVGPFTE